MRFSLLGPLTVTDDLDSQVALGGPRLRVLLAALLLRADLLVPADELAEVVWDGSPPPGAISTLRSYVRRLRRAMGDDGARIVARDPGYLIHAQPDELDVLRFEALCGHAQAARGTGDWAAASAAAQEALRLWRADPLLDIPSEMLREKFLPGLRRLRLQVAETRFDAGLRLGEQQEVVPQLLDMAARYPLHERFHAQLMLALAATGRRAQALHAYQQARRVLIDELGIEPGAELRDIHQRILAGDPISAYASGVPSPADAMRAPRGPAQLPADIPDYTGREAQAAAVCTALTGGDEGGSPGVVRVVVIAGAAGLGKTTLAVHAAHQVRDRFPDGQLLVQLTGASRHPAVPGEVLGRLLRDLGVAGDKIPAGTEERAALYRTQLAGRRVLIVLDDARDAAQVRPLLPGSASCTVLVTTRNSTPQIVGTAFIGLDTLPGSDALELLSRIVGDARLTAEPEAAAEIVRACAGLPLAIRICGARLATRPRWPIATMAALLRDERRRLDELQVGDLEVRASFRVSYDSLSGEHHQAGPGRVLRLLGLWPGQRIGLPAAAALIGEAEHDVAATLETLVDMNLLESPEPNWYQLHDLLRLFAAEQAQAQESEAAQAAAVTRLLQWYLTTATAMADLCSPNRYRIPGEPPSKPAPGSSRDALDWYDREHPNLIPLIRQAAAAGLHDLAWRLATSLYPYYNRSYNWADCVTAHRIAVTSARIAGSRLGEAWALHHLGYGLAKLGHDEAFTHIQEADAIRRELGDSGGESRTSIALTEAHLRIHGPRAAYEYSLRSLELLRRTADPGLLGIGLNNHGDICISLGKTAEATECLQQALGILTAVGGGNGQGQALENLGQIYLETGRLAEALTSLSEAHRLYLEQGHVHGQAQALKHLGRAQHRTGQAGKARESLQAALALFRDLDDAPEAEYVQRALAALEQPAEPA